MIKLPIFILIWILFLIFRTVIILLGLIIVPPLAILNEWTTKYQISRINNRLIINWKWKLFYLWSNDEDGILAGSELLKYPNWVRIIYWTAIRNPANNLRFIKYISCQLQPGKIKYVVSECKKLNGVVWDKPSIFFYDDDAFRFISLTYQGLFSNLRIQFKMNGYIWRFWIGWKIYPHDSLGISSSDYRRFGAGFATQFKRIYPRVIR